LAFDDPRSALFFEFARALKEIQPKYFLLENVKMKKEHLDVISDQLGTQPVFINSALVSAQNRQRFYWANFPITQPKDLGITLQDVIQGPSEVDLSKFIVPMNETFKLSENGGAKAGTFGKDSHSSRVYHIDGKAVTLCGEAGGGAAKMGQYYFGAASGGRYLPDGSTEQKIEVRSDNKSNALTSVSKDSMLAAEAYIRKLTPVECERLQTLPDNYTEGVSNSQRYRMLGNGWTVEVIKHIFKAFK